MSVRASAESRALAPRLASSAGAFALLAGALTLVGWLADIPRLTDWNGNGIAMFANTAVCACLSGLALLVLARKPEARERMAGILRVLGGVIAGTGILTLFEHATGRNLGIDTLLVHEPWGQEAATAPMRMGPPASVQDGLSFIRQARVEGHTTPALAVTAFARNEDRDRALKAGYQGHITKPVDISTLITAIAGFAPTKT